MKISFVCTVYNEESTITQLLNSIFNQSRMPDEVIIVDGGSRDQTIAIANSKKQIAKSKKIIFKTFLKKGNRSVGRNEAIRQANGDIIVCSDAGCILDKDWVKNIIEPFTNPEVDVVAGYYKGKPKNIFEKCLIPYVLVMEDKINSKNFLPSTRSMAFKQNIWKKAGGFNEKLSHNEDYAFAQKLKKIGGNIAFAKKAVVYWTPRKNLKETFIMFFRFAFGDGQSLILRNKVMLLFARYILGLYFLLLSLIEKSFLVFYGILSLFSLYVIWSIKKNYRYVKNKKALFFLPILQFTSDFAVLVGTTFGLMQRLSLKNIFKIIKNNKSVSLIIVAYSALMFFLINWGIPNINHPFSYFMDEWHQAQAVRAVFTQGSPNVSGSANGSMFHFLLSGLWLAPFILIGIVNPFSIGSSIEALEIQQRLFQILRLNTLFFGISSVILIVYIAKKYFSLNKFIVCFLFVVNPIWLNLSNYFKYDIALVFWIILSFLMFLRYLFKSSAANFFIASFVCGIAFSVKISAFPLLLLLIFVYFYSTENRVKKLKNLFLGIFIFFFTFLSFGIPDLLFGKGNISEYLYDNLVRTPSYSSNYVLGMNYIPYLFLKSTPAIFGYSLFFLSSIAAIFMIGNLFRSRISGNINKSYLIVTIFFLIFALSLFLLKIEARGNRLLVLLPFVTLLSGIFIKKLFSSTKGNLKRITFLLLVSLLLFQLVESFGWIGLKLKTDIRQSSSIWIENNILLGKTIGIENIPIYQSLPDILLKDFYIGDNLSLKSKRYTYEIINNSFVDLSPYVVVTNEETISYMINSPKKNLVNALEAKGYNKIYYIEQKSALFNLFRSKLDYYMSGLIQAPLSISIYKKS